MKTRLIFQVAVAATLIIYMFALYHHKGCVLFCGDLIEQSGCLGGREQDHIFFLKMHKCGSSTVQNILMRRGYTRELNFVLPSKGHYLGSPNFFSRDVVDGRFFAENEHFDIFTHHSRFSAKDVDEVMPPDTKKVTILREPAALFESLYNYYRLNRGGFSSSLATLLDSKPEALHMLSQMNTRWGGIIGFNQMAFDAGLWSWEFEDMGKVDRLIAMMDSQFDLVMLAEHMEESMVLLADLMCWPLKKVAFISLNARPSNSTHRTRLSDDNKHKLHDINAADVRIYEHFKAKFERRLEAFGADEMARRVDALKAHNRQLTEQCIKTVIPPEEKPGSPDYPVFTYEINEQAPQVCHLMTLEELKFTQLLKDTQLRRFNAFDDYAGAENLPPV